MSTQPSETGGLSLEVSHLAPPRRAAVPPPPPRKAAAAVQAAPAVIEEVQPPAVGQIPVVTAEAGAGEPPAVPIHPPAATSAPTTAGSDLTAIAERMTWQQLITNPTKAAVAAKTLRRRVPGGQFSVRVTGALLEALDRHTEENNLGKSDLTEAILRAYLTEQGEPVPIE